MTRRRTKILKWALERSAELKEQKSSSRSAANHSAIDSVCLKLLDRKTPLKPTAKLVSEIGSANDESFPAVSTLFNQYAGVLSIWREAYFQIRDIDVETGLTLEELLLKKADVISMDEGTAAHLNQIISLSRGLLQRYNALKEIITKNVPVNMDSLQNTDDEIIDAFLAWSQAVTAWGFTKDEAGLKVSRSTSSGTLIMDAYLFDGLVTFAQKAKRDSVALGSVTIPE